MMSEPKTRNVTLDAAVQVELNRIQAHLEHTLDFKPTLSQTIRYMIRQSGLAVEAGLATPKETSPCS